MAMLRNAWIYLCIIAAFVGERSSTHETQLGFMNTNHCLMRLTTTMGDGSTSLNTAPMENKGNFVHCGEALASKARIQSPLDQGSYAFRST
jgi:hypothetical protein